MLVFVLFAIGAGGSGMFSAEGIVNWGTVAGFLGVIAVGAALLMVAGEFDLSIGSMIGFAGMLLAVPCLYWGWPVWLAVLFAFGGRLRARRAQRLAGRAHGPAVASS